MPPVKKKTKPGPRWRRLMDSLAKRELLVTPHLEKALALHGDKAFPERYEIPVVNKERHWDGYFHPSGHAHVPPLLLYYMFHPKYRENLAVERFTSEDILAMQLGSAYHAVVQSLLIHLGFTNRDECEVGFVDETRHCSGQLDIRRIWLPNGEVVPAEIKSWGWLPQTPVDYHVKQFQIYLDLGCGEPQEKGCLLYFEKQRGHRFREFVIRRDEEMLAGIYTKWRKVLEAVELNDHSALVDCCSPATKQHRECPARFVCRIGPPPLLT